MEKTVIRINGMFCPHCEKTISGALTPLPGVEEVQASYRLGQARVTYDPELIDLERMHKAIVDEGYEIGEESMFLQLASILVLLVSLYVIARQMGWTNIFNLFPSIESGMTLGMLFLVGAMTSIHCIAMCGGINLTQAAASANGSKRSALPSFLYNLGRVISYTITGAICGAIGQTIGFSGKMRGILPAIVGFLMLIMACNMLGVFKTLRGIRLHLPASFYTWAAGRGKSRSSFVIGLLNGLMPCGPLQSMQIYALGTGSVVIGALSMFLFSLGTVPLMFGFGFLAGKLNQKYRKHMLSVSALLVFLMGIHMMADGLALSGIDLQRTKTEGASMAMVQDGVQEITTEIDYGSYPAFIVQEGIPLRWNIYVPEGKLNGCNGEIVIPDYELQVKLQEGDNIVEFTPEEEGTISFTCWMGMIKSQIEVMG